MALVNHAKKEINAKIVYYGPAGSGKNSALTYIYSRIKPSLRGDLKNVPSGADNLLFFDFSPFESAIQNGFHVRLHVYTLTGPVCNPAAWKMILKGADGIVIVTSQEFSESAETVECITQLRGFLSAYGVSLNETPAVFQFDSSDRQNRHIMASKLATALELSMLPIHCSTISAGEMVIEPLTMLFRQVLDRISVQDGQNESVADLPPSSPEAASVPALSVERESLLNQEESPRVTLLSHEIRCEGKKIRIPLEIALGSEVRTLVVTVDVALE